MKARKRSYLCPLEHARLYIKLSSDFSIIFTSFKPDELDIDRFYFALPKVEPNA